MADFERIMQRLFDLARSVDRPAAPRRGSTVTRLHRRYTTRAPWCSRPPEERRRIRKAARIARRRNRSTR